MATEGRGRRGRRKKVVQVEEREEGPTTLQDLPDHLLELVLLRVGTSLWLVRAAAACWRWYRLVADAGFLAMFCSLHAPHIIGEYSNVRGWPLFVPSSPATAPLGRHFSLDFLPDNGSWDVADSRGSLLLLSKNKICGRLYLKARCNRNQGLCICSKDLIVCEPHTGRYQGILWPRTIYRSGVFLVDGTDADRRIGMSNFRVIAAPADEDAWVFSSDSDGDWRRVSSNADVELPSFYDANLVGRANGSIYWGIDGGATAGLLVLHETTAESSHVVFPENIWGAFDEKERACRVIGGDDGALRVVRLINNELNVFVRRPAGNDEDEWLLEKLLNLPEATAGLPGREEGFFKEEAMIVAANARYVLLAPHEKEWWVFTVELDTMKVEREHERNRYAGEAYPYELPWPPAFGLNRADRGRERKRCQFRKI